MVKAESRTELCLLGVSKATKSRARTRTRTGTRSRLNCCNLSQLLLRCVHTGYQIVRLWLVSGPQLVHPGQQATDVIRLLLP